MLAFATWLFWTLALGAVALALAYRRVDLRSSTAILGLALFAYIALAGPHWLWALLLLLLWGALAVLNLTELRRERVTAPMLRFYKTLVPQISTTEREALEAGTVWWDGELFTGLPDWSKLTALPPPRLTDEERAFLDGPTEELCRRLDDWEITHELGDMPREIWAFIIEQRFFAMIIPKRYGGLEFSPLAVAAGAGQALQPQRRGRLHHRRAQFPGPGRAAAALRDRCAEGALPAAPGPRRGNPLLRPDQPARRVRRVLHPRYRRRVPRHVQRARRSSASA